MAAPHAFKIGDVVVDDETAVPHDVVALTEYQCANGHTIPTYTVHDGLGGIIEDVAESSVALREP